MRTVIAHRSGHVCVVAWQGLVLLSQAGTRMTALLLVWQCTEHLDCTYGQMGIVKHDAGTLGVSWVTHGAPNMLRIAGDDRRHDVEIKMS